METILALLQGDLSFLKIGVAVLRSMVHQDLVIVALQDLELLPVTALLCQVVVLLVLSILLLKAGPVSHCHLHRVLRTDIHPSEDRWTEKIVAIIVLNMILGGLMY
jgi:hypothetical protein